MQNYPTVVNNIPKSTKKYTNDHEHQSFADIDCALAGSQRAIGESSNLAQLAQTYATSFANHTYDDYAAILAVLAQVSIDSAKRLFACDVSAEIQRIKAEMDVKEIGYPSFWAVIRPDVMPDDAKINPDLQCPMNYLYNVNLKPRYKETRRIPVQDLFVKHDLAESRRRSKRIEDMIVRYGLEVYNDYQGARSQEIYLLLRHDFDTLVDDIRRLSISKQNAGLMSWLIGRAFARIEKGDRTSRKARRAIRKNKPLLMRVLYTVNPEAFLMCFKAGDTDEV